jgi:hypothetical protein
MFSGLLPGLRELRAPLVAGYLWLLLGWLTLGDELPTAREAKAAPLDRLYRLEPIVSDLGLAVVASVVAYMVGSVALDIHVRVAPTLRDPPWRRIQWSRTEYVRGIFFVPVLASIGFAVVAGWLLPDSALVGLVIAVLAFLFYVFTVARVGRAERDGSWVLPPRDARPEERDVTLAGWGQILGWLREKLEGDHPFVDLGRLALDDIARNRDLLKTRILDVSEALHAEVDRPDAEATFRMATWPPLTALVTYLAVKVSPWWSLAFIVPVVLAWQRKSLRKQANDALVTALVVRDGPSAPVLADVKRHRLGQLAIRNVPSRAASDGWEVSGIELDVNDTAYTYVVELRNRAGQEVEMRFDSRFRRVSTVPREQSSKPARPAPELEEAVR